MECVRCLGICMLLSLVVGLVCAQSEGDIRLIDGYSNSNQGRVEVFHDSTWGTVCGQDWGSEEAVVVCRQLDLGDVLLAKAFFGNGSGPILVGTHCHDHDFHITDCHGTWEDEPTTCTHEEDVAVICYPEGHVDAPTGLTTVNSLIIAIALGIFCWLVLKIVTFIEDSKVRDDEVSLHEVRTDDHSDAASQHVSISDECDVISNDNDVTSKNDATVSKDDVTSGTHGAASSEGDVTSRKNDVPTIKNDDPVSKIAATKIKSDVTASANGATTSKDDVNNKENYEKDGRQIPLNKPGVVQTSDVSVQTLK